MSWAVFRSRGAEDGPGASLASATPSTLTFDFAELWVLQGTADPRPSSFFMLPVALHEVGHCLGLAHSRAYADVMGPYYVAKKVALSDNDRARARAALVK